LGKAQPSELSARLPSGAVAVTLNAQNDAVGVAAISSTEVDYYKFTPTASGAYTISGTTPTSNLDTVLGVFSASGQRLAYNDDITYARNTDSRITLNLTAGTTYYVGVTNYWSFSRGAYTWTIDGPNASTTQPPTTTDDAYESNDTFATAYNLGTLSSTRTISQLVMTDGADWFHFTTTAPGVAGSSVSIAFQNSQGDLQLQLYNSAGTLLGASQGTGNGETISLSGRAAGDYYVRVYGANNPSYALTVTPPAATTSSAGGFQITLDMTGLTASEQAIFQAAANRWSRVITGDIPNATYRGQVVDDLLISASGASIDGVGGILGQSGPDAFRSGSDLPIHATMEFDSADMASMESSGLLYSVVLHEMGHALGIGTIWQNLGLISGAGTSNPIFTGANATAAYNALAGTNAAGVPVEATGGPGTALGHWRETTFGGELMTGWAGPGVNLPLSSVTIGALADMGYQVNFAAADSFTLPGHSSSALQSTSVASSRASLNSFVSPASASRAAWIPASGCSGSAARASYAPSRDVYLTSFLPTSRAATVDEAFASDWRSPSYNDSAPSASAADTNAADATDQAWNDWDACSVAALAFA
jgi:hypothetical protein